SFLFVSFGSPVGHPASVKVEPSDSFAPVGQPVPLSQWDLTRFVPEGSNWKGTTFTGSFASSSSASSVQAVAKGSSDRIAPRDRARTSQSVFGVGAVKSAREIGRASCRERV